MDQKVRKPSLVRQISLSPKDSLNDPNLSKNRRPSLVRQISLNAREKIEESLDYLRPPSPAIPINRRPSFARQISISEENERYWY